MSQPTDRAAQIIQEASETVALQFIEEYEWAKAFCGSPIEELVLAALMSAGADGGPQTMIFMGDHKLSDRFIQQETIYIHQQAEVGRYRADFLIHDASLPFEIGKPRLMAVECDGHDFHEKTKRQAQHDKRRDRFFQSMGIKLLRFTGSEIWANPEAIAEEIIGELACDDAWRARGK